MIYLLVMIKFLVLVYEFNFISFAVFSFLSIRLLDDWYGNFLDLILEINNDILTGFYHNQIRAYLFGYVQGMILLIGCNLLGLMDVFYRLLVCQLRLFHYN